MRHQISKSEPLKKPKRPTVTAKKKAKSKKPTMAKSKGKAVSHRREIESESVGHETDIFDKEEYLDSPRRNPSQARLVDFDEEEDRPRKVESPSSKRK